jgi:hypothetical protein
VFDPCNATNFMPIEKHSPTKWKIQQKEVQRSSTPVVPAVNDDAITCARRWRLTCQLPATTRSQWHTSTPYKNRERFEELAEVSNTIEMANSS